MRLSARSLSKRVQSPVAGTRGRTRLQTVCKLHKITLLPGDGIGPEITDIASRLLVAAGKLHGETFEFQTKLIGGAAIDATGIPLPADTLEACKASDAVLLAAIGG